MSLLVFQDIFTNPHKTSNKQKRTCYSHRNK